jgi:hypothetical protein
MRFVNNFSHLIDYKALNFMLSTHGNIKPDLTNLEDNQDTIKTWRNANYDLSKIRWENFTGDNFTWPIALPFEGNVSWWFSKLMPGDMFPLHIDTYFSNTSIAKRYWMSYQDYTPGHVFIYGDKVLTDYRAGDLFEFDGAEIKHAAANLGLIPKISLQLVVH